MKILSVNVGRVANLFVTESGQTHRVMSGIRKQAVEGAVLARKLGLEGDEQADLSVHGGLDKAVYAYPSEHYAFWEEQRRRVFKRDEPPLVPGAMGENLTIAGLLESDVWVGDRLEIGGALLEVTEPRSPCYKFGARMGFAHALKAMLQSGYTGFYLKVLREGPVAAGDGMTLAAGPREVSIARINAQRYRGRQRDLF